MRGSDGASMCRRLNCPDSVLRVRQARFVYAGLVCAHNDEKHGAQKRWSSCVFAELQSADLERKIWAVRARDSMIKTRGILPQRLDTRCAMISIANHYPSTSQEIGLWNDD